MDEDYIRALESRHAATAGEASDDRLVDAFY